MLCLTTDLLNVSFGHIFNYGHAVYTPLNGSFKINSMEQRVLGEANSYPVNGESLYIYETSSKLKEFSQSSILCNISAYLIFLNLITEVYLNM